MPRTTRKPSDGFSHKQAVEGVRKLVTLKGGKCWVLAQSARLYGSAGIPDCFCVIADKDNDGNAFWVEVKVGRDKLSPSQILFKDESEFGQVPVIVGTSLEVEKHLATFDL